MKTAVASTRSALTSINSRESKLTRAHPPTWEPTRWPPTASAHFSPHPDHYNEVITQPHFSSPTPSVALSRSLSTLADNDIDSAACQIHAAVCSYKSNSECLQTEFEFIKRSSKIRTSINITRCSSSTLGSINKVNLHRAWLALGWLTMSGFNSWCGIFISVCNQPLRSTQPGHPFMDRRSEYQPNGNDTLELGSKGRYGLCVGGR